MFEQSLTRFFFKETKVGRGAKFSPEDDLTVIEGAECFQMGLGAYSAEKISKIVLKKLITWVVSRLFSHQLLIRIF